MHKAGPVPLGKLSFGSEGGTGLAPFGALERAQAGADLLGVPIIEQVLTPRWSCGSATLASSTSTSSADPNAADCWPPNPTIRIGFTCAIELKPRKIAARI